MSQNTSNANTSSASNQISAPSLNVYKKIAVVRRPSDTLTYEDSEGNRKFVAVEELGEAIHTATPLVTPRPKLDIPVPKILNVETYELDVKPDYEIPRSYVRSHKPSIDEWMESLEYVADAEDEEWLAHNAKFGGAVAAAHPETNIQQPTLAVPNVDISDDMAKRLITRTKRPPPQVTLNMFECMMDSLEKATGFKTIITVNEAETLITKKLPQLANLFPPKATRHGVASLRHVIHDVYTYWVQKRSKLKRPLLRQYWPVTSSDDTNPHLVFRPREKEKYKLRKKRQNDMDAYRKMKQLRNDFDNLKAVLELVRHREELNRAHVRLQIELFRQRLYDIVDTSGQDRVAEHVDKDDLDLVLDVPSLFDIQFGGRKAKRGRGSGPLDPVSRSTVTSAQDPQTKRGTMVVDGAVVGNVAGRNNGEPAPLFLQPLPTRETFASSWEGAVPHVTTYIDAQATPTLRFRHRPRVGRGGRIVIDRVPCPKHPNGPDFTVFTAGTPMPRSIEPKERLLDLLPRPLDHQLLSRRIQQISADAIKEDFDAKSVPPGPGADHDENDGEEIIVKIDDWLDTDDQLWGPERFSLGPI